MRLNVIQAVLLSSAVSIAAYTSIVLAFVPESSSPARHEAPQPLRSCGAPDNIVGVILPDSMTDGDPLEVACGAVSDVRDCTGTGYAVDCTAVLDGVKGRVLVAGVDFPIIH